MADDWEAAKTALVDNSIFLIEDRQYLYFIPMLKNKVSFSKCIYKFSKALMLNNPSMLVIIIIIIIINTFFDCPDSFPCEQILGLHLQNYFSRNKIL